MGGYRETSFDPWEPRPTGRPMCPYNWVQWTGVGLVLLGLAIDLLYFAGRLSWTPKWVATPSLGLALIFAGIALINSRREGVTDPAPELAAARKRWAIIVTLVCVAVFGAALTIDSLRS